MRSLEASEFLAAKSLSPGSEGLKGMSAIVPVSSMNVSNDVIGRSQADSQGAPPLAIIPPCCLVLHEMCDGAA